jgi:hypothetical protein
MNVELSELGLPITPLSPKCVRQLFGMRFAYSLQCGRAIIDGQSCAVGGPFARAAARDAGKGYFYPLEDCAAEAIN